MDETRADFQSRVSVRASVSGVLVTVALMILLMSPAGNVDLEGVGAGLWLSASLFWIISVTIGAVLAARVSRSLTMTDGLIHGLVVWAGSFLFFGGFAFLGAEFERSFGLGVPRARVVWGGFLSDAIGLAAALVGGVIGARWESRGRFFKRGERRQARGKRVEEFTEVHV